jgi:hypothetical protein
MRDVRKPDRLVFTAMNDQDVMTCCNELRDDRSTDEPCPAKDDCSHQPTLRPQR